MQGSTDPMAGSGSEPARRVDTIVPADGADLAHTTRSIYVGGTGDITLVTVAGDTVVFKAVPVGVVLPVCATRVKATGTTATFLVGLI